MPRQAPLFIGIDVRNMSAATRATLSHAPAIAINQDPLGVQGVLVNGGPPATAWGGGVMLNVTECDASPDAALWTLTAEGRVVHAASGQCLTVYACGAAAGAPIFAYDCVTNACGNELWEWRGDARGGQLATRVAGRLASSVAIMPVKWPPRTLQRARPRRSRACSIFAA